MGAAGCILRNVIQNMFCVPGDRVLQRLHSQSTQVKKLLNKCLGASLNWRCTRSAPLVAFSVQRPPQPGPLDDIPISSGCNVLNLSYSGNDHIMPSVH